MTKCNNADFGDMTKKRPIPPSLQRIPLSPEDRAEMKLERELEEKRLPELRLKIRKITEAKIITTNVIIGRCGDCVNWKRKDESIRGNCFCPKFLIINEYSNDINDDELAADPEHSFETGCHFGCIHFKESK